LISHGFIFTILLNSKIFNFIGIILFVLGGIYFIQGILQRMKK